MWKLIDKFLDTVNRIYERLRLSRCYACRLRMRERTLLCPRCRLQYEEALAWECGICGKRPSECLCVTEELARARVRRMVKLFRYRTEDENAAASALLFFMKKRKSRTLNDFYAAQLADAVQRQVADYGEFIITFAPRTRRLMARYGFDQSELLARALGRRLGIPARRLLVRRPFGRPQKSAEDHRARVLNVQNAFRIKRGAPIAARVILLDDISTSGATLAECARVLRRAGVKEVLPVTVAFVAHNPNQKYEEKNRVP